MIYLVILGTTERSLEVSPPTKHRAWNSWLVASATTATTIIVEIRRETLAL